MEEDRKEKGHKSEPWTPQVFRGLEMRKNLQRMLHRSSHGVRRGSKRKSGILKAKIQQRASVMPDAHCPHPDPCLPTSTLRRFLSPEMTDAD